MRSAAMEATPMDSGNPSADAARLLQLIGGAWTTQAIGVAAALGLPDRLAGGARTAAELAGELQCDPGALRRLLRALASLGVCVERDEGAFELTAMGGLLCAERRPSLRSWAIWWSAYLWRTWGSLLASVRTGSSARQLLDGQRGYAHLEGNAAAAEVFNRAMSELTQLMTADVLRSFDFAGARHVVDVGGGHGELLVAILLAHAHLRGTLFDLPHALDGARAGLARAGVAGRCAAVAGSFFEAVPAGADVYLLKSILHNWDDRSCRAILTSSRRAMDSRAALVLVERVLPDRMVDCPADRTLARTDLNMLVGLGGRERTRREFAGLLSECGLREVRYVPTAGEFAVIEARVA